jgi:hypothetical protein
MPFLMNRKGWNIAGILLIRFRECNIVLRTLSVILETLGSHEMRMFRLGTESWRMLFCLEWTVERIVWTALSYSPCVTFEELVQFVEMGHSRTHSICMIISNRERIVFLERNFHIGKQCWFSTVPMNSEHVKTLTTGYACNLALQCNDEMNFTMRTIRIVEAVAQLYEVIMSPLSRFLWYMFHPATASVV